MILYKDFLNEENDSMDVDFEPGEKLRKSIYQIISNLEENQQITFNKLSEFLANDFKINISGEILKEMLSDWDTRKVYTIFKKEDNNWMDVYSWQNYVKKKARYKQNFGKHRNKTTTWKSTTYKPYVRNGTTYYGYDSEYFD